MTMVPTVSKVMIGDWLLVDGKVTKVTKENIGYVLNTLCQPLPLTPEILEKNGWEHDEQRYVWDNNDIEFSLEDGADGNKFWWKVGENLVTPINYVHQLQRALDLCERGCDVIEYVEFKGFI